MKRKEAVTILEEIYFKQMSTEERLNDLEELWFSCDSEDYFDDDEMPKFPIEIKQDIIKNDRPENPSDPKYDFIIKDLIKGIFYGVKNEFLEDKLREFNAFENSVIGKVEDLIPCDCCSYHTISPGQDGICQICPVCFWENFGAGPNHMLLRDAQKNFKKFGAMDRMFIDNIDKEGQLKYVKSNRSGF